MLLWLSNIGFAGGVAAAPVSILKPFNAKSLVTDTHAANSLVVDEINNQSSITSTLNKDGPA